MAEPVECGHRSTLEGSVVPPGERRSKARVSLEIRPETLFKVR
jgi:hypothetical protein